MSVTEDRSKERIEEDEIEIRLSDVVQFLKDIRWNLLRWAVAFLIVGLIYAFAKEDEFTAAVRVMPELKGAAAGGGLSDLKSLAGLAGVNLDNASSPEAIRPDLYPDIVQSIPFTLYLLNQPVVEKPKPITLENFLVEQSQSSLSGRLLSNKNSKKSVVAPSTSNIKTLTLTDIQEGLSKQLNKRVKADIDKKTGIVIISSTMPNPAVAAVVAQQTLNYLTNYVTSYRTGKARQQVEFLSQQVNMARQRYQSAEYTLSSYRDRNRSLFLNTAKIEEQRLQADYLLAQTVYNDLSKQLEQARIKVQEEAPVFQVLEPARIPLRKSGPNRMGIALGFVIVGIIAGVIVSFTSRLLNR